MVRLSTQRRCQVAGENWLTADEAAKRLKVNVVTIRRWLRDGRLPGQNLGHRIGYRIKEQDVEAVLAGGEASKKAA